MKTSMKLGTDLYVAYWCLLHIGFNQVKQIEDTKTTVNWRWDCIDWYPKWFYSGSWVHCQWAFVLKEKN